MAVLHDLVQPVGADEARTFVIGGEGFRRGDRPQDLLAFLLPQGWRVGDGGQNFLVVGRYGHENPFIEVVAQTVGFRRVTHAAVDLGGFRRNFRLRRGPGLRGIGAVPVEPDGGKERFLRAARHQNTRNGAAAIGDVGHGDQFRVFHARNVSEAEFGGVAGVAPGIEDQRLPPELELIVSGAGSESELRVHGIVLQSGAHQFALRHLAIPGIGETQPTAFERMKRGAAVHAGRDFTKTAPSGTVLVDDSRVSARIAEFKRSSRSLPHARAEVLFEVGRQDGLLAGWKRQRAFPGIQPHDLSAVRFQVAPGLRFEHERLQILGVKGERIAIEIAGIGVGHLRDLDPRKRGRQNDLLPDIGRHAPVNEPPLLPPDVGELDLELLAARVAHENGNVSRGS
ncbi:MAG: hypothetical protein IANPNBLG_01693 [Bryobacteraceae bacterium]|nr:hypothetical protein [Bryobacteraceae bacterium]